jgi:hypothetical protein
MSGGGRAQKQPTPQRQMFAVMMRNISEFSNHKKFKFENHVDFPNSCEKPNDKRRNKPSQLQS